jgi:hypothetical protein
MLKNRLGLLVASGLALAASANAAATDLVTYTAETGAVTFAPGGVVTPVITGVIAAVTAAAALFVISLGIRWLYKLVRGAR